MSVRKLPAFDLGDHVEILPLDNVRARVIALELDHDGWTVVCRYFQNGKTETAKLFVDELKKVSP